MRRAKVVLCTGLGGGCAANGELLYSRPMSLVAVDAHGGLHAPSATVQGAALVSRSGGIDVLLVGDGAVIARELAACSYSPERLRVHETSAEDSLETAVKLVADGTADALVTAGDPPSALRACARSFRRMPGLRRAPLATVYPTAPRPGNRDPFALILDVGATVRATALDLVAWARMGGAYAARISGVEAPTVGLLSSGRSPDAGPPEVLEAHRILAADARLRFVGNVEGIDIPRGAADVVVCDGFMGQVVVGVLGGVSDALVAVARGAYQKKIAWRMGLRLLEDAVVRFSEVVDHDRYGGAPLLGFDRTAILALPACEPKALANTIRLAAKACRTDVIAAVAASLSAR